MKKILLIHTEYTQTGGEDIAVRKEIEFLSKYYSVETLIFKNTTHLTFRDLKALLTNRNKKSIKKLSEKLNEFKPDYIYIHNLWFRASLGILDFVLNNNFKVFLKLHNFRYDCTKSFLSSAHLGNKDYCGACGLEKIKLGKFNKYYQDSYAKSFLVNNFGRKYFKMLKNNKLKILTLTEHHKNYLIDLGVYSENIYVQPNPFTELANLKEQNIKRNNQIVYAGRLSKEKGLIELVKAWESINSKGYKLLIMGEGPLYAKLENLVQDSDSIELTGYKKNEEVIKIIRQSKAVVTATKLFEGQPTLLCEASAYGIPSIFPDTGGVKDFFPKDYDLKFKQHNYRELTEKLQKVIDSEDSNFIGKENQLFIQDYLDDERIYHSLNSILSQDSHE
tara:strand:- start:9775 stop:10944 length:1170 start_codon:yes stop_codon:yes gene_type:complete